MSEVLIAVAVTLILVDVFVATEFLSVVAYALISITVVEWLPVSSLYAVATGVAVFGVLLVLHFQVLRGLSVLVVDKYISPTKVKSGEDALIGQTGAVCDVSGKRFVRLGDQLCEFVDDKSLSDGTGVKVTGLDGMRLVVIQEGEEKL